MKVSIKGIKAEEHLFHNIRLNVYPKKIAFKKIDFWRENYRTSLHIELLEAEKTKSISQLTLSEITEFLVGRYELRLADLAESIEKNGVKVPLIILSDGLLLDGNRRYFACSYIFHETKQKNIPCPEVLKKIPVLVIKTDDVDERIKQKILAEANFVPDYKVPWTLDVKAKVISDFYKSCIKSKFTPKQTYEEIEDVYSTEKSDVDAYIETLKLTKEFVSSAPKSKRNKLRDIVLHKFLYFWEFRNKALKGGGALNTKTELPKVKNLFFKMIKTGRFKNFKQVEPMIRAVRDKHLWALLNNSEGSKIDMVEAILKEQRVVKSAEDRVRNFLKWLQTKSKPKNFTNATLTLLKKLKTECSRLIKQRRKK